MTGLLGRGRSIDPSGRGCSEAIAPAKSRDLRSLNADASVFRDFIERFLELGHRCIAGKLSAAGLSLGGAVLKFTLTNRLGCRAGKIAEASTAAMSCLGCLLAGGRG